MYERRGYSWVRTSEEMVRCRLQAHCFSENNTPKIIQNTRKCFFRHVTNARFSNFRGWRSPRLSQHAMVLHSSKCAPGRQVETGVLSETNVFANRRSSKISDHQAIIDVFLLKYAVRLNEARVRPTKTRKACDLANYLFTVSCCSSWHCRLHSCPVWANKFADTFQPLLQGTKKAHKNRRLISDMN